MPGDKVNSATMIDWAHKQPWSWYAAGATIVIAGIWAAAELQSIAVVAGQIQDITGQGVHPHVANVRVVLLSEKDGQEFLRRCSIDARQEDRSLMADLSNAYAHASMPPPPGLSLKKGAAMSAADPTQTTAEIQRAYWRYNAFPVAGFYFARLPESKAAASTTTDQQGNFSSLVPRNQRYLLAAQTYTERAQSAPPPTGQQRRMLFHPPDENRYWLLWVSNPASAAKPLSLDSSNTMDHRTEDNPLTATLYDNWQK